MKSLAPRRVHTGDRLTQDAQRSAQEIVNQLNGLVLSRSVLIHAEPGAPDNTGLAFSASTSRSIAHGLGRKAIGWFEVYAADVPSSFHVGLHTTAHPAGITSDTHVTVTPAATGTCYLIVF